MKNKILLAALLLVFIVDVGFQMRPTTQRWEYKVLSLRIDKNTEQTLNGLGSDGWEMVSFEQYTSNGTGADAGTYHFKRQKH